MKINGIGGVAGWRQLRLISAGKIMAWRRIGAIGVAWR